MKSLEAKTNSKTYLKNGRGRKRRGQSVNPAAGFSGGTEIKRCKAKKNGFQP